MSHRPSDRDGATSPTVTASWVITLGHLRWMAWVWLVAAVIYTVVITAVGRYGEVDESLWQSVVANWQRWIMIGAGVTTTTSMLRLLVSQGLTRARFTSATAASMAALAFLGATFITIGYAIEAVAYERLGFAQELTGGQTIDGPGDVVELGGTWAFLLAAYFATGWLLGIAYHRRPAGLVLALPALLPAAVCDLLLTPDNAGIEAIALSEASRVALLPAMAGAATAIVLAALAAKRLTHAAAVR